MATGRQQVLPTGNVDDRNAAFHHVLWSLGLQTPVNRCTETVVQSLGNMKPMQLGVQQTGTYRRRACERRRLRDQRHSVLITK